MAVTCLCMLTTGTSGFHIYWEEISFNHHLTTPNLVHIASCPPFVVKTELTLAGPDKS